MSKTHVTDSRKSPRGEEFVVRPSEAVKIPRAGWIVRHEQPIASPEREIVASIEEDFQDDYGVFPETPVVNLQEAFSEKLLADARLFESGSKIPSPTFLFSKSSPADRAEFMTGFRAWLGNLLQDVQVLKRGPSETQWIPLVEIHRPKIAGCSSELTLGYKDTRDFSFDVSVVGLGGGVGRTRQIGFSDAIACTGDCMRLELPIDVQKEDCRNKAGASFSQYRVLRVRGDYQPTPMRGTSDACHVASGSGGIPPVRDFSVPVDTKWTRKMSVSSGKSASASIGVNLLGVDFGLKYSVTLLRSVEFSYTLAGPGQYDAFQEPSGLTYYWTWK